MKKVYIGKGKYKNLYEGKGVYAARDFKIGEVVVYYNLKKISPDDFNKLPKVKRNYAHSFWGKMYLFYEPACYVNHSSRPNTVQDLNKMCDVAIRHIRKKEVITTNATIEVENELKTFVEAYESPKKITNFKRVKGAYRNAVVSYLLPGNKRKSLKLKRVDGNWQKCS